MRKLKTLRGWGIFQNNEKEINQYGFNITVLHPDNMEYAYLCSPSDSDIELDTVDDAINWIKNY